MIQSVLCALGAHRWHSRRLPWKQNELSDNTVVLFHQCLHCGATKDVKVAALLEFQSAQRPQETITLRFNPDPRSDEDVSI